MKRILYCRIFGHKWKYYKADVDEEVESLIGKLNIIVGRDFRICLKCDQKEQRHHHTGMEKVDWSRCELNKEELRNKKLKDLGV